MKFTNTDRNIEIELINPSFCKVAVLDDNHKQLEIMCRLLNSYERRAPLEGGSPIQFQYSLDPEKSHILITGNVIGAMRALYDLDFIDDNLHGDIIEQITLDMLRQAIGDMPIERRGALMSKIQATTADLSLQRQHSPALFVGNP